MKSLDAALDLWAWHSGVREARILLKNKILTHIVQHFPPLDQVATMDRTLIERGGENPIQGVMMENSRITNATLKDIDWAKSDRLAMLNAIPKNSRNSTTPLSTWMEDVSGSDRRSVKAQLRGLCSFRAAWWNLFSTIHQVLSRSGSLENAMYDFHRFHHGMTIGWLTTVQEYDQLALAIRTDGPIKATKAYLSGVLAEIRNEAK